MHRPAHIRSAVPGCVLTLLGITAGGAIPGAGPTDPPGASLDPAARVKVGSLATMISFAISVQAQILEIYADDWRCTFEPDFAGDTSSTPSYPANHADCVAAGYPATFAMATQTLN